MSKMAGIFDWETLSIRGNAVVLSLGILIYDEEKLQTWESLENNGIEIKFDIKEQIKDGRHVDSGTIDWWKNQGKIAQRVLKPSDKDISYKEIPEKLNDFFKKMNVNPYNTTFFTRGQFDYVILQDIYAQLNVKCPIPFWKVRDIRTVIDTLLLTERGKVPNWEPHENTTLHCALDDCKNDMLQMQAAWELASVHSHNLDGN